MENNTPEFQKAAKLAGDIEIGDNSVKLKLYALYKQATVGKNKTSRPGMFDMVGKAKWYAWASLEDMGKEKAEKEYIDLVASLQGSVGAEEPLLIGKKDGILTITFNRPAKKNAVTILMFKTITKTLQDANLDNEVKLVVITGRGDYFCSGNDLNNFAVSGDLAEVAKDMGDMLEGFFASFIDLKKPLIAVVNGPAIGVGVTTLGLCDTVFASDKATFSTPFTSLGITPECCSSYLFPKAMGYPKAGYLLLFGGKLSAKQAETGGIVTQVFEDKLLNSEAEKFIQGVVNLPTETLVHAKELLRGPDRNTLHLVNKAEIERQKERWLADDCRDAAMKFLSMKNK